MIRGETDDGSLLGNVLLCDLLLLLLDLFNLLLLSLVNLSLDSLLVSFGLLCWLGRFVSGCGDYVDRVWLEGITVKLKQ